MEAINLFMTLKQPYFDQIKVGVKREEYREIKPYWTRRLEGRKYDTITFQNGYSKTSPRITLVYRGYYIKELQHPEFKNKKIKVYAIKLGTLLY